MCGYLIEPETGIDQSQDNAAEQRYSYILFTVVTEELLCQKENDKDTDISIPVPVTGNDLKKRKDSNYRVPEKHQAHGDNQDYSVPVTAVT